MNHRWDETWHRLLEWTTGQAPSERLSAQILLSEGYTSLDPSHPLGGPDGGKDALCEKYGKRALMAVYFPRGQQTLGTVKSKFLDDLGGLAQNGAKEFVFVTNQELSLSERAALRDAAGATRVELYHLERITAILDKPAMSGVRKQFLGIEFVHTWPEPALGVPNVEQLASHVEAAISARVEILAQQGQRIFVWLKPPSQPVRSDLPDVKTMLLRAACVLSAVEGVESLEIGLSNTSELPHSVGGDGMGCWRIRFGAQEARRVATSKKVDADFWKRAIVVLAAGDNFPVDKCEIPFDEFEAKA